ncbi:unnamed protein product [Polarella glacialis]|uniref:ABC transporter domain-containing protein n=2 Tax=Polarella glacialis TaxID=89957 RepID=A0A813LJZ7_POLGL|nr:unnamed protein product [Polarella glacialis]
MTIHGFPVNTRTCFSGQACKVERMVGYPLDDGDRLMVMYSDRPCGRFGGQSLGFGGVTGFPMSGFSEVAENVTEHGDDVGGGGIVQDYAWGAAPVFTPPGLYQLCWCSGTAICENYTHFTESAGYLNVVVQTFGHLRFTVTQKADLEAVLAEISFEDCSSNALPLTAASGLWTGSSSAWQQALDGAFTTTWVLGGGASNVGQNIAYDVADTFGESNGMKYFTSQQYELCRYKIAAVYNYSGTAVDTSSRGRISGWTVEVRDRDVTWAGEVGASLQSPVDYDMLDSQSGHVEGWDRLADREWLSRYVGPGAGQYRFCTAGMPCRVVDILGVGLQLGDKFLPLSEVRHSSTAAGWTASARWQSREVRKASVWDAEASSCGSGFPPAGFGSAGGVSQPVDADRVDNASTAAFTAARAVNFDWGKDPITAPGGQYRLCWCGEDASGIGCQTSEHFQHEAGHLIVDGPNLLPFETYSWICIIDSMLAVKPTGYGAQIDISPSGGSSFGKKGSTGGWLGYGFGRPVPTPDFSTTCIVSNVYGESLSDGDRLLILDRLPCDEGLVVPGWPGDGLSKAAENNGSHFTFPSPMPSTHTLLHREVQPWGALWEVPYSHSMGAASYGVCWCSAKNGNCSAATAQSIVGTIQTTALGSGAFVDMPSAVLMTSATNSTTAPTYYECPTNTPDCHQNRGDFSVPLGRIVVLNHTAEIRICWQRCQDKYATCSSNGQRSLILPSVVGFSSQYDAGVHAAATLERSGGHWHSASDAHLNQWLVLDLRKVVRVVQLTLNLWGTTENPKNGVLQQGPSVSGPWTNGTRFQVPSAQATVFTVKVTTIYQAQFLRLLIEDHFGARWGMGFRGPLRLTVEPAVNFTGSASFANSSGNASANCSDNGSNGTGNCSRNAATVLPCELWNDYSQGYCRMGCGLMPQRTYATLGLAYQDRVPPTGDEAVVNFEWPPWIQVPNLVDSSRCESWAETCSEDPLMQAVCLDSCQFWRGPASFGEQGFYCQIGVDLQGASIGVDSVSRITVQNSINESCLLNITGQNLMLGDTIQVVPWNQPCRTARAVNDSFVRSRAWPSTGEGSSSNVAAWRVFSLGEPQGAGPFQVCYCPSLDGCQKDTDFMKWVGTVAVVGRIRRLQPPAWDLEGIIEIVVEITDLQAPILNISFGSDSVMRECTDINFKFPGQEHTMVSCILPAAPAQTLERVTVFATNGLWASSEQVFNRFKRGTFLSISDRGGPVAGGDPILVTCTDLSAPINRITVGGQDCVNLYASPERPNTEAMSLSSRPHSLKFDPEAESLSSLSSLDDGTPGTPRTPQTLKISQSILHSVRLRRQLSVPVQDCFLRWKGLQVSYRRPEGPFVSLHDCSGFLRGGELLAIMGPSGAGKSTLLDTLTMRKTLGDISGQVTFNGKEQDESFLFASAYVAQEDNLVPTNTVRETVEFYADLTLPVSTSADRRRKAVAERLQSVGLAGKENQFVGGRLPGGFSIRGLSGGERRRLSIAAGVVHSPPLVFLDEPTSGLDAFSALCVMESIRAMARHGHAVACTIHQPRQAILDMFDKVAFLAAGRLVYLGPPTGVKDWLLDSGLWDPERAITASVTDIVLDCITVGFEKPEDQYGTHTLRDEEGVERLALAYQQRAKLEVCDDDWVGRLGPPTARCRGSLRPGRLGQYWTLQKQQFRIALRSPGTIAARVGLHLLIGILIGSVYYNIDHSFLQSRDGWGRFLPLQLQQQSSMPKDRIGVLFLLCLSQTVTPNCAMSFFLDDRQYYSKEAAARLYTALPYHVANAVTEALICVVNALLASGIATSMAGLPLSGNWGFTMLIMVSNHLCASAMVQMCARLSPNQDVAYVISAGYIILCMLFANVLVKVDSVTPALAWLRWICSLFFAMAGLAEVEFAGTAEHGIPVGDAVAADFLIHLGHGITLHEVGCLAFVWAFYLLFSVIGFLGLKFLSRSQV